MFASYNWISFDFCWPFLSFVIFILFALCQAAKCYSSCLTWLPKGNQLDSNIVPKGDHHAFSYICLGSAFCIELMINLVDSIFFGFFPARYLFRELWWCQRKKWHRWKEKRFLGTDACAFIEKVMLFCSTVQFLYYIPP